MAELKTKENDASVDAFLDSIDDEQKREDSKRLRQLFEEVTGDPAKMWGSSIVGFGSYHYKSTRSSQEGDWMAAGFSPRKNALTLYMMGSYEFKDFKEFLDKLGKHKTGKGCLYIKRLSDVDEKVLRQLIDESVKRVKSGKSLS